MAGFQVSIYGRFWVSTEALARVAVVIRRLTGVRYHPANVWRLLQKLEWTLQRPAKRARERDEAAIREWVSTRWPKVKKMVMAAAPTLHDENRVSSRRTARSETSKRFGTRESAKK